MARRPHQGIPVESELVKSSGGCHRPDANNRRHDPYRRESENRETHGWNG